MEQKKPEVDVTKGLMKQTKAQLIDIILRKDDREKELLSLNKKLNVEVNDIKNQLSSFNKEELVSRLNEEIANKSQAIRKLMFENNSLRADFEKACDEHVSEVAEYKSKIKMCTLATYILAAVAILALLFGYMGI